ncbi:MAG: hypothetical protein HC933_09210 [Pleurocapsa sp. SU_196_0]|nr:hypothetical protein [Pleurocapsa sp. SU_196_0]
MSVEVVSDAACLEALGLKARAARRRLEMYKRIEGIDGELTHTQLADLLEISQRATVRGKSVEAILRQRQHASEGETLEASAPNETTPIEPLSATKADDVLGSELRALRHEGQRLRRDWEQLELHQKSDNLARAAWENRLRHAEEEMNALWDVVETLLEKIKLTASSQTKLERRIGFSQRRNSSFQKTGRPKHAAQALDTPARGAETDSSAALETIEIQMSNGVTLEPESKSSVGNETEVSQRSLT